MACGDNHDSVLVVERVARTAEVAGCSYASPVIVHAPDPLVVVATTEGVIIAYEPDGDVRWQATLSAITPGDRAWIGATPAAIDGLLVVAWQDADAGDRRHAHHAAVIDAATGKLDVRFSPVRFAATKPAATGGIVTFNDATAFSRSKIIASRRAGEELGVAYVSFGNIQDIQPWHGWVFELDLARWRVSAADAISSVLLTTPESSCGTPGESGSDDMICGGGIWAPSGPTLVAAGDDDELWLPTGNGQLDLGRSDYANTIMRTRRGLSFAPMCDAAACAGFDPLDPSPACVGSCRDLFIPRLRSDDPALSPPNGLCDGMTFFECYARLDLDLGASSPALVEIGTARLAVLPAKDGAVYLFDADHFGTLYDRLQLRDFCGTNGGSCSAN